MMETQTLKKGLSRRTFGKAGVLAGLGTLLGGSAAQAAQPQVKLRRVPRKRGLPRPQAARAGDPAPQLDADQVQMGAFVQPRPGKDRLILDMYLFNESEEIALEILHSVSGAPADVPTAALKLGDQTTKLAASIPYGRMVMSRAVFHEYRSLPVASRGNPTRVLYARYESPWPEFIRENPASWARKKAQLLARIAISVQGLGKKREVATTSAPFHLPNWRDRDRERMLDPKGGPRGAMRMRMGG